MVDPSKKKSNIFSRKKLPDSPGVYFFLGPPKPMAKETLGPPKHGKGDSGENGEILYIGKATSLRDRVRSYFTQDLMVTRGPKLQLMIERATNIKWRTTDSVLEALLLESYLIKKHQPPYNTDEKDDKSYNYVVITKEKFPRVLLMRGKDLLREGGAGGSGSGALETFSGTVPATSRREKVFCEVDASPGRRLATKTSSADQLKKYKHVFGPFTQGGSLREAMKIVRRIFPFRDQCVPAEAVAEEGEPFENANASGEEAGRLSRGLLTSPYEMKGDGKRRSRQLSSMNIREASIKKASLPKPCFNHQIGLCPGVCAGKIDAKEYAKTIRNIKLFFEGKKRRLVKRLEQEMHEAAKRLEFEKANEMKHTLFALGHIRDVSLLKKDFLNDSISGTDNLEASVRGVFRIEAYDAAHMGGKDVVGVMTVVENGAPNKAEYRQFKIREGNGNDLASLEQMLMRRFMHREWRFPSLIVVDGFDLQINTARKVLQEYGLDTPIVSVVKDDRHKAREILGDREMAEKHHDAILLANSEAHRFAITFHRKRRAKRFISNR